MAASVPFEFSPKPEQSLLVVTKRGYWDMTTFEAFAREFRHQLRRMRSGGGCQHCLVDATAFAVQSGEVSQALLQLVESFTPDCPQRMAGVTGSKLSELQARRNSETPGRRAFCDRAAAETWLFSDNP